MLQQQRRLSMQTLKTILKTLETQASVKVAFNGRPKEYALINSLRDAGCQVTMINGTLIVSK